jgi:hypothetical protein
LVDLALLQSVSYIAGALGVCVAAAYYVIMLRNTESVRRKDLIVQRLQLPLQYHDAYWTVLRMHDFETLEEFLTKYGSDSDQYVKLQMLLSHYNSLGTLMKEGLAESDQIFQLYLPWSIMYIWEKFLPVMMRNRILPSGVVYNPEAYKGFELLYLEAKRKYPKCEITFHRSAEGWRDDQRRLSEYLRANPVPH